MAAITLDRVCKSYGAVDVMHEVSMEIRRGELMVFVGPSGCGKSTLLRMIAGLEEITDGTVEINGRIVNDDRASKRGVAMVFQSYALYPHMTVEDNMSFSLKIAGVSKAERRRKVREAADMLKLTDYLKRRPRELSGGQRQRVAIGRAIVRDADIFLFDEPLSNLDAALRISTRAEIAKLKEQMPDTTMVYVTHDQVEAMTLADRIVVLNGGRVEQIGTPEELYTTPRNLFVAGFIGSPAMNMLPCRIAPEGSGVRLTLPDGAGVLAPLGGGQAGEGTLGIRPEALALGDPAAAPLKGTVDLAEYLGDVTILHVRLADGTLILAKLPVGQRFGTGDAVGLTFDEAAVHAFGADGLALTRP